MYGLCLLYLRASLAIPDKAARFKQAIALVINYDADEMGKSLCCLGEDIAEPVISLHVEDFLSVYSTVRHVSVEFPPCRPEWDFGQSKPVY